MLRLRSVAFFSELIALGKLRHDFRITHNYPDSQNQIPTGFRLKAQSWREERAPTLGTSRKIAYLTRIDQTATEQA